MSGECPKCTGTADGEPGVRSCTTPVREGMKIERETGWPSTERDLLAIADRFHKLMPVGFYYKTFIRPRFAWPLAERIIRRATGGGRLPEGRPPEMRRSRHLHTEVLVIGGGVAGLSAGAAAAERRGAGGRCDEGGV